MQLFLYSLIMAALWNRAAHCIFVMWFLLSSSFYLFSSPILNCPRLDVYHTCTHDVDLVRANLGCRSEMCCTRLTENTGRKKIAKNSPPGHHRTTLSDSIFATKACIDSRKKLVKQRYLLNMSSQYGELRPTNGCDRFTSLGHPSKF